MDPTAIKTASLAAVPPSFPDPEAVAIFIDHPPPTSILSSPTPKQVATMDPTTISIKNPLNRLQMAVTLCLTGVFGLLSVPKEIRSESPISFHTMSVLIALTISFLFVSDFVLIRYPPAAGILEFIGMATAAAALFTALCITLTTALKCVVWGIFAGTVAGVLAINFFSPSPSA